MRCCPHKTETSSQNSQTNKMSNRAIVPSQCRCISMSKTQIKVSDISAKLTLLQEFQLYVLITWRSFFSVEGHNRKSQCRANVGLFSPSNKVYQTQVESRVRCRTDQYTIQVNIFTDILRRMSQKIIGPRPIEYCDHTADQLHRSHRQQSLIVVYLSSVHKTAHW